MTVIDLQLDAPVSPERFITALTDFSADRAAWWPNLDARLFTVHSVGATTADVTEGSRFLGDVWERNTYDWSTPGVVRITVTASNTFAPGSGWLYELAPRGNGSTVHFVATRIPASLRGRLIAGALAVTGRRYFTKDLTTTFARLAAAEPPRS